MTYIIHHQYRQNEARQHLKGQQEVITSSLANSTQCLFSLPTRAPRLELSPPLWLTVPNVIFLFQHARISIKLSLIGRADVTLSCRPIWRDSVLPTCLTYFKMTTEPTDLIYVTQSSCTVISLTPAAAAAVEAFFFRFSYQ